MSAPEDFRLDRTGWPPGPWDDEPDRVDFRHAGLACFVSRNYAGAWCGYAGVPPGHPWHGVHYSDPCLPAESDTRSPSEIIEVHGDLTYSNRCNGSLCHTPEPGEPHDVWWFGFDCGHWNDVHPRYVREMEALKEFAEYRDLAYVRAQTERLAEQLAEIRP